jgi:hypothetical protein
MVGGTAVAKKPYASGAAPASFEARTLSYGGLVGQMIGDLDSRLAAPSAAVQAPEAPADVFHTISVACGYIGLLAGFAAAAGGLFLIL